MDRRLVPAGVVVLVGGAISLQLLRSSLRFGQEWVLRTGWVGLTFGVGLVAAGVYIAADGRYELLVRVLCVGWATVIGGGLVVWTAIAIAAGGSALGVLGFTVVVVGLYLGLFIPTALDVYQWGQSVRR